MPNPIYDTSKPVLVTGATGFLAGWIVKDLLEQGFTVHAAVRDPNNKDKVAHLEKLADASSGNIKFFKADLLQDGSYEEAMQGCGIVFHTASPFISNFKDPQKELVDPAVNGTRTVLNSANKIESVTRVVLTSSCVAIYGHASETTKAPTGKLTEAEWNNSSSLTENPYSYSKTMAEKAAWKIADAQSRWKLVVINPALISGPSLSGSPTSDVFSIFKQMADGAMKSGVPHIEVGVVDMRDVSTAHINAAFIDNANGRNIVFNRSMSFLDICNAIGEKRSDLPLPSREMPKWLIWLVGPMVNSAFSRNWVSLNVGHAWRGDNSKAVRELGLTYMPVEKSVQDMVQNMTDLGLIKG